MSRPSLATADPPSRPITEQPSSSSRTPCSCTGRAGRRSAGRRWGCSRGRIPGRGSRVDGRGQEPARSRASRVADDARRAAGPLGMADHALGAGHRDRCSAVAQGPLHRRGLDPVVQLGARAVEVDVVELVRPDPGVGQGELDRADRLVEVDREGDAMPGVAGARIAEDLAVDPWPRAPARARSSSRTSIQAPSPRTKPSRSRLKGRLARAGSSFQRASRDLHQVEPGHDARGDRGVGPAGQDEGRLAVPDAAEGVADGVGARRAPGRDDVRRPAEAEPDRDLRRAVAVRARRAGRRRWPARACPE